MRTLIILDNFDAMNRYLSQQEADVQQVISASMRRFWLAWRKAVDTCPMKIIKEKKLSFFKKAHRGLYS